MTIATLDPTICPDCGQPVRDLTWSQPALVRHGGYGATETTTRRYCRCGWGIVATVVTDNPRDLTPRGSE